MRRARVLAAIIVLLFLALASWPGAGRSPSTTMPFVCMSIPKTLGDWQGHDDPLSERQYRLLETRDVLLRTYRNQRTSEEVLACVVVAEGDRKVAHPPEVCYQGQGWTVLEMRRAGLDLGGPRPVQWMRVRLGTTEEVVLFWYRAGQQETNSVLRQHWNGLLAEWRREPIRSGLIRFSTRLKGGDGLAGERTVGRFAAEFLPVLDRAWNALP